MGDNEDKIREMKEFADIVSDFEQLTRAFDEGLDIELYEKRKAARKKVKSLAWHKFEKLCDSGMSYNEALSQLTPLQQAEVTTIREGWGCLGRS